MSHQSNDRQKIFDKLVTGPWTNLADRILDNSVTLNT